MSRRRHWHDAIKDASAVQSAAVWAATEVQRLVGERRLVVPPPLRPGFQKLLREGPNSPVVAAFTQFEAALREYWAEVLSRSTTPPMRDLVTALASRQKIPSRITADVHRVRRHRNAAVHDGIVVDAVDAETARRALGLFLARLPDWD